MLLKLDNVSVQFNERKILDRLDLSVARGEFVVIIGDNGAGKSTLFNVIAGQENPTSGRVVRNFLKITRVMQDPRVGTLGNMTVKENLAFAYKRESRRGWRPCINKDRISMFREKLKILNMNLEDKLNDTVQTLSGGQRQALAFAMAVLVDYDIILLDEVTAALNPESASNLMELINRTVRIDQKTCLMITHNPAHEKYGDRVLKLENGRLYDAGPIKKVK
ncbi:MAG: ATP-binding cassette domain-containing protein [Holosporales bacterium]|jgi:putative ABC transport system ATP-binding protein|nr:ATP-binding cassette domain-containing protein [Holosporales bacterium]